MGAPQEPSGVVVETTDTASPRGPTALRFITSDELASLPPPVYLVEGLLFTGTLAVLAAAPERAKTFLALSLSLAIGTGTPWLGRTVRQGPVAYIAAEGAGQLARRVEAWRLRHRSTAPPGVHFLPHAVVLTDPSTVTNLLTALHALPSRPALIVVDTLARCFEGDENSSQDMGRLVRGIDRLHRETGAAVLLVHHTGWDDKHERGSNALRGAADTVLRIKMKKARSLLALTVEKQKDGEIPADVALALDVVTLPDGETSCVIRLADAPGVPDQLQKNHATALNTLASAVHGLTYAGWMQAAGLPKATFDRARNALLKAGHVTCQGKLYVATAKVHANDE